MRVQITNNLGKSIMVPLLPQRNVSSLDQGGEVLSVIGRPLKRPKLILSIVVFCSTKPI